MLFYQQLLCDLLDKELLKSNWFYQNETIAAIEQMVSQRMILDELFDADDVQRSLKQENLLLEKSVIEKQIAYMALGSSEQRLIFREVIWEIYGIFRALPIGKKEAVIQLANALRSISQESDELGKVLHFVDEYVYGPKFLLLLAIANDENIYTDDQRIKLARMKPKFAKYFLNCYLEALDQLANIAVDEETLTERRQIYGRIKNE